MSRGRFRTRNAVFHTFVMEELNENNDNYIGVRTVKAISYKEVCV